jgi:hypothetical protein
MFFDFFRRNARKEEPELPQDQAVIINIDFEGLSEYVTKEQQDAVYALQDKITEALPENSRVDGDEFGDGSCTIYVYGPSADDMFHSMEVLLRKSIFNRIDITLQYGPPEDPSTVDKNFSLS